MRSANEIERTKCTARFNLRHDSFATDTNGEEWIQIPGSENSIATLDCTLIFERTDAKVKFIVQTEAGDTNWQNFSFRPKDWQVHQVPVQALVMKDDAGNDADGADAEYFDSPTTNFEEITRDDLSAFIQRRFLHILHA